MTDQKNYVCQISPHHAGFGQWSRGEIDRVEHDSAKEYAEWCMCENTRLFAMRVDGDSVDNEDEDQRRLQDAIDAVRGRVVGGHGTLVAFLHDHDEISIISFED